MVVAHFLLNQEPTGRKQDTQIKRPPGITAVFIYIDVATSTVTSTGFKA
jgi:hypothetical protein